MCERDEQGCLRARRARRAAGRCGCDVFEALTHDVIAIAIARGAVGGVIGAEAHEGWDSVEPNVDARRSCRVMAFMRYRKSGTRRVRVAVAR